MQVKMVVVCEKASLIHLLKNPHDFLTNVNICLSPLNTGHKYRPFIFFVFITLAFFQRKLC